ncbi:MAG: hypothetical protein P4M09_31130, partial [Devosia sp.]|nr:hypothetical protein [Devosia sp.]
MSELLGIYGDDCIEDVADDPNLVLFGRHFVAKTDRPYTNANLREWLQLLSPIGGYVLASRAGDLADSIKPSNVMALLRFGDEWEKRWVEDKGLDPPR